MNSNTKVIGGGIVAIILLTGIYLLNAPVSTQDSQPETVSQMGKVGISTIEDGTYYVFIKEVIPNPEDTVIRMHHVTYFEGEEARLSAQQEAVCESEDIEDCVQTLQDGYYVRESGAEEFTVPAAQDTEISNTKGQITIEDLTTYIENLSNEPVFTVAIENGQIVTITQVTP